MKRLLLAGAVCLASNALANSGAVNAGASMTTGASSSSHSISAAFNNPAMTSLIIHPDENWRLSYFPSISINNELGNVNDFIEELEDLADIIDDPGSSDMSSNEILDRFNLVLENLGESGYVKNTVHVNAPILPLFFNSELLQGSIGVGIEATAQAGLTVLDDELRFNEQNGLFSTGTSIYLKTGIETNIAVAYSRELPYDIPVVSEYGKLYVGGKIKFINMELSKQVIPVEELDSGDISDIIKDEYDNNLKSSSNIGLDVGVVWDADLYRVGLTIENLNSPDFDYGTIGENCHTIDENTIARSGCDAAAVFAFEKGEINTRETHTKHALTRVDGLYKITSNWVVTSALDLAKFNDIVGFENQWFHLATSYDSRNIWIPSGRFGYQQNLAGSKTSSVTFGFTLFKTLAMDFEYGLDEVDGDGTSVPQRLGFALSLEESF